jgi:uncharacterized protein YdhG (YjbR/CyaY superfamily)
MEEEKAATELAELMVELGTAQGKKTIALITDMNQPLGHAVGNSIEVIEAIETLKGKGPDDLTELSLTLAGMMIFAGEKARSWEAGFQMAKEALKSGCALSKLEAMIRSQGGDHRVVHDTSLFPRHSIAVELVSVARGFVHEIKAKTIGLAAQRAGAGRMTKEDKVDLSAGIYLNKKVGDAVSEGEVLATIYGNEQEKVEAAASMVESTFLLKGNPPEQAALVRKIIGLDQGEIDEYIQKQPATLQVMLLNVREAIRRALPEATEKMSYQMPTFWMGRNLIHFAAQKNHLGIYPGGDAMKYFAPRLTEYKTSKGAIQFPYKSFGTDQLNLISEIAAWCGKERSTK